MGIQGIGKWVFKGFCKWVLKNFVNGYSRIWEMGI